MQIIDHGSPLPLQNSISLPNAVMKCHSASQEMRINDKVMTLMQNA